MESKDFKHTPAPWFPVQYAGKFNIQTVDYYAENDVLDLEYSPNAEANAKAIAATPDLIFELNNLINACVDKLDGEQSMLISKELYQATQALKKATE